jgi:hypothetical protein
MEQNSQTPLTNPQPVNPIVSAPQPQVPSQPQVQTQTSFQAKPTSTGGKKWLKLLLILVVVLVIISVGGYFAYNFMNVSKSNNATVYNQPTNINTKPTATLTPQPEINPNDTSNQSLDKDSTVINQNLDNASSDLNGVDQSFSDKATNLQ